MSRKKKSSSRQKRKLYVKAELRAEPDLRSLSRALLALAMAQAEAEAAAAHEASEVKRSATPAGPETSS